ncbi:putative Acyltransferase 3 domain-containing protein [Seiridium cardinale]|uniref:Acyltransferase 3 domain-containing protein n=1 Tax=Seiridium cardinale TaxID=138064 RepID=A0ABR2X7P1_9PEZI
MDHINNASPEQQPDHLVQDATFNDDPPISVPETTPSAFQWDYTQSILTGMVRQVISSIAAFLTPEILQNSSPNMQPRHSTKTAWIQGLRGWLALTVVIMHLITDVHPRIELCFGAEIDTERGLTNTSPIVWPIFRVFFLGGGVAVSLFFFISGYIRTRKLFLLLHQNRTGDFMRETAKSIFRRPLRLYMPVIWTNLAVALAWHTVGLASPYPVLESTIWQELYRWMNETWRFLFFYGDSNMSYNMYTWTIPIELRGSMLITCWLLALHHLQTRDRIVATACFTLYHAFSGTGTKYAPHIAGMLTAELEITISSGSEALMPWIRNLISTIQRARLQKGLFYAMLVCGLYLGSQPSAHYLAGDANVSKERVLGTCFGWKILSQLIPSSGDEVDDWRLFWLFWAGWLLFIAIKESPVKKLFERRFLQCECISD